MAQVWFLGPGTSFLVLQAWPPKKERMVESGLEMEWQSPGDPPPHNMALGTLDILSWRNLRNDMCGKDFNDMYGKQVTKPLCERCPRQLLEERSIVTPEDKRQRSQNKHIWLSFPQFITLSSHLCSIAFSEFPLFIKPSRKALRFNGFSESSFPYEGSHVT